uniref:Uncharacterized protein n=1 Tax=Fagus sylvatica TaxID=28930 RepID=A0A2N9IAU5_FAGSY
MAKHSNTIGPDRQRLTYGSWRPDRHHLTRGSWRPDQIGEGGREERRQWIYASQFSRISFRDVAIWCYCVDDIKVAASQFSRISFRDVAIWCNTELL